MSTRICSTRGGLAVSFAALIGCGGPAAHETPHAIGPGRPLLLASEQSGAPTLTVVVATPGAPEEALLRGERLAARLRSRDAQVVAGAEGVRLSMPLPAGGEAALIADIRASYMDRDTGPESQSKREALLRLPAAAPADAALARCRGEFYRSAATPHVGSGGAVSLGVAAPAAQIRAVRRALADGPSWGIERAPAAAARNDDTWMVQASTESTLRGVRVEWSADARTTIALGRQLAEPGALNAALGALGVTLERVDATLSPAGGACLAIGVRANEGASPETLAPAFALLERRLTSLQPAARVRARAATWLVEGALSTREIAERAAYLALAESTPGAGGTVHYIVRWPQSHGEPAAPTASALQGALERARAERAGTLPVHEEVRAGLAESWMLLASPCGTRGEGDADAGASAAYALAAAHRASALGVTAMPWVSASRVGLLLRGDGARLAEVAARAWLGEELAFEPALRELERLDVQGALGTLAPLGGAGGLGFAEGDAHAALALGDVPVLRPFGSVRSRRALRATAVRLRGEALARGPLALGVLTPNAGEGARVAEVIGSVLPARTSACPARSTAKGEGGARLLRLKSEGSVALAILRVPRTLSDRSAHAARAYLERNAPTWLASQVRALRVEVWGEGDTRALVMRMDAPTAARSAAVEELRRALARTHAGWPLDSQEVDALPLAVDAAWATAAGQPPLAPRGAVNPDDLRALCAPDNLLVVMPE